MPSATGACLAAFGKHPGWNDHIDDLGLQTVTLALAKQVIYLEGLSSQIDAGAWEKLAADSRLEGFDHLFLWQRGSNLLVGSIVSSSDGKGRTRYPIILCAQLQGVPLELALSSYLPRIEAAMAACKASPTADGVRAAVEKTHRALAQDAGGPFTGATPTFAALRRLPERLGPGEEGLLRILYQIKSQLAGWGPGRTGAKGDAAGAYGVHLRLPQGVTDPIAGLTMWSEFFQTQLDAQAPRLLLWPRAGNWVDVVVGRPAGVDFFGLRANTRAIPFVNDVPYSMDEEFRTAARALVASIAADPAKVQSIFGGSSADGGAITNKVANFSRALWRRLTP